MNERVRSLPKWAQQLFTAKQAENDQMVESVATHLAKIGRLEEKLSGIRAANRIADLDQRILNQVNSAMEQAIVSELTGYQKPLSKIVERVISAHDSEIYSLIDTRVSTLLTANDFRQALQTALNDKLARILVSRLGGELEKRVNELRASPEARARITLAITQVIDEIGK